MEDAKVMNQWVIVSNLPVHEEQLKVNASFLNPENAQQLASILLDFLTKDLRKNSLQYNKHVNKFSEDFISIVKRIVNKLRITNDSSYKYLYIKLHKHLPGFDKEEIK